MDQLAFPTPVAEPLAQVRGEPLHEMPLDLFIPPDALRVFLEAFEGPLDLLLYLIRRQNVDVLDIPMASLTAQYMEYVEAMKVQQLELAAEYLLMAAVLIEIKSRLLLPRPAVLTEDGIEEDPRAALVRRLLEYEQIKAAALRLDHIPQAERDFQWVEVWLQRTAVIQLPDVHPADLLEAWQYIARRARLNRHHQVSKEGLSVRQRMSELLKRLQREQYTPFVALFDTAAGVADLVVSFLALLELCKERLVHVAQSEPYQPIYAKLV